MSFKTGIRIVACRRRTMPNDIADVVRRCGAESAVAVTGVVSPLPKQP